MKYLIKKIKKGYACLKKNNRESVRDNFHLLHSVYEGLIISLRKKELPGEGEYPRLFEYAAGLCKLTKNKLDKEELDRFLDGLAKNIELTNEEIALLPEMFSAALFLSICRNSGRESGDERIFSAVKSLRFLKNYANEDLYEKLSGCEKLFIKDEIYRKLDRNSKNLYRHKLAEMAKKEKIPETELLRMLFENAAAETRPNKKNIGSFLFEKKASSLYMPITIILPFAFAFITGILTRSISIGILTVFPYWEIIKTLTEFIYSKFVKPEPLLRVNTEKGVKKTLVAQITLINDKKSVDTAIENIETTYFANKTPGMFFGILADLPSSKENICDADLDTVLYLKKRIITLNEKHQNAFFAAVRKRTLDEKGLFSGRERKRGAVEDFLNATRSKNTDSFLLLYGDIKDAVYFCALDSDTVPQPNTVRQLVGILEYPPNKPLFNNEATAVESGYAVAAPRMEVRLSSARENLFSKIISGFGGVENYSNPSFSLYQDLYGEGIFAGKGVIEIESFLHVLHEAFPENTVLSHDILEGSLLRTAYASDVIFTDNTPKNLLSFCARDHRWIRGDIQNLIFLKKPFSNLSKYKIFDNARRVITPISLLLLFLLAPVLGYRLCIIALAALFLPALLSILTSVFNGTLFRGVFFRTKTFSHLFYTVSQPLFNLFFLPYLSWIRLNATAKALFRLITKKNLLEWTTAAQAEKKIKGGFLEYLIKMPAQFIGLVFIFAPHMLWLTLIWIAAVPAAYFSSRPEKKKKTEFDVLKYVRDMWRYFADFQNESNNFLPPDNFQQTPLGKAARRTSPTNIGLSLLCALGAYDMGIIDESSALTFLENALSSIERMEKWNGHLYNWYSTATLKPLTPRYVSSVDNGNYAAFLYTLKNGVSEIPGRRAENIAARIEKILNETDFSLLYDKKKNLFHIGFDVEKKEFSSSYYDLYASEARLLSYYAIAKRQVPLKNWQTLSRFPFRKKGRLGIKSWTGTMFEYFMPNLLLPAIDGSLCDEALRFALAEQIKAGKNGIWGISESGFYSFDNQLSYQYKAFGAQSLALKKSSFSGAVISPYSTWLTLPLFPEAAVKNLKRLEESGMYGKYGFYEALDFSVAPPATVCSFMVHHIGMSMLSAVNFAKENIMQKRFMSNEMKAFEGLLEEKLIPVVVNYKTEAEGKHRKERYFSKGDQYNDIRPDYPNSFTLSNKTLTATYCDSGISTLSFEGRDVIKNRDISTPKGLFVICRTKNKTLPLTYFPLCDPGASYRVFFDDGEVLYYSRKKDTEARLASTIAHNENCQIWNLLIKNNSQRACDTEIIFYTEPVLSDTASEQAHPAFSALFIECIYENGILYFHRRRRDREDESLWLAISASDPFEFETTRFSLLEKGGEKTLSNAFSKKFSSDPNGPVDPCAALKFKIKIPPRGLGGTNVFFAVGKDRSEADAALKGTMKKDFETLYSELATTSRVFYENKNIKKEDVYIFNIIRSSILKDNDNLYRPKEYRNLSGIENLWKYGVSGNYPIMLVKMDETCVENSESFMKAFFLLKRCKINCEAVFCFTENSGYDRPIYNRLRDFIIKTGLESFYEKRNGIFLVNLANFSDFSLLAAVSRFYADLSKGWSVKRPKKKFELPEKLTESMPLSVPYIYKTGVGGFTENGFAIDDKEVFKNRPPWTHILCNASFGTVLSESTLGYTYAFNSQKNPLTPWENDTVTDNTGEKLLLYSGKRIFDIISGASCVFEKGFAYYEALCNNVTVKVKVFVPVKFNAKIIELTIENNSDETAIITYSPQITMGRGLKTVNKTVGGNAVFFSNPLNSEFGKSVCVLFGNKVRVSAEGLVHFCEKGAESKCRFVLGCEKSPNRAHALIKIFENPQRYETEAEKVKNFYKNENGIQINTGNKEFDLFFNNFLQYQIRTCRLLARSAFYQSGGAYGFRDQLQDAAALVCLDERPLKHQIIRACRHQFEEGDAMHWWHDGFGGRADEGIRSRSSDDFLWLVFAVCEYIEKTNDFTFLQRKIAYLKAPPLEEHEDEKLISAVCSERKESVYMHCVRALEHGYKTGPHGLILFGSGDWNDGMNRVSGESVWTTMFYIFISERFCNISKKLGDEAAAEKYTLISSELRNAVEKSCYEDNRYIRAVFPDGRMLGSSKNKECCADILPQAFASMCDGFDKSRVMTALTTAEKMLVDKENKIVKLFTPPLKDLDAGYVSGYLEGIRENGGQYTHAAVWLALGFFKNGQYEKAFDILDMLNPVNHSKTLSDVQKYRVEPYVLSADIYSNPAHTGMGGWSWYTGAAGWYFKVVTENLLGLKRIGNKLYINPELPEGINGYEAKLKICGTQINLTVKKASFSKLIVDGEPAEYIPLDRNTHKSDYFSEYLLS